MREHRVLYITYDGVLEPIAQSQVLNYIKELARNDFRFYLVSFEKINNLSNLGYLYKMDKDLIGKGITWLRMKYHKTPKVLSTFFDVIAGMLFCSFVVWRYKIKIIHARAEVAAAIALVVSRLFHTKFIYDRRGTMAYDYIEGGMWPRDSMGTRLIFALVNAMDKRFLLFSDYTVVLTHKMASILKNDFSRFKKRLKIKVIPCCVDLERFKPKEKDIFLPNDLGKLSHKFILIYSGSLGTWNTLKEMADFFIQLKRNIKNAHLLIITQSDHEFAKRIINEKKLTMDDYTIIGKQYKDMPDYLTLGDAAIMFRKPGFSKIASCPTKFAEYLACGLPIVINSGIGDTEELIQKNKIGVIVNNFSFNNYDQAIRGLLLLIEKDGKLRSRCRNVAEQHFSLNYGVECYLEVYRNLQ